MDNDADLFPPHEVRVAFHNLVRRLQKCAHRITDGEVHVRLALDPRVMLEPVLQALEATMPEIQALHFADVQKKKQLSTLDAGPKLLLTIKNGKDLKETQGGGIFERPPNAYAVARFVMLLDDGSEGVVLQQYKTLPRNGTCAQIQTLLGAALPAAGVVRRYFGEGERHAQNPGGHFSE